MKLCSRLLTVFGPNFCENGKFEYMNPILGKLGVTHEWLVDRWKGHGRLSIDVLLTFLQSITVPELSGKRETLGYPMVKTPSFCVPSF